MKLSNLRESLDVAQSRLPDSRFRTVDLSACAFDDVNLGRASFTNVNLTGATLHDVNLSHVRITAANTTGMTINGADVTALLPDACDPHAREHARAAPTFGAIMPVLRVVDLQRSIHWYVETMGFAVAWRRPNDGGGENALLRRDGARLMISTGAHLGATPGFAGTLYFEVTRVASLFAKVKDVVELVWPLSRMEYGTDEFGVRDPDGYVLAFAEDVPSPAQ